jgi:hypothetical protein
MATKYIDTSISGSSFPTTYTGPGTLAASCLTSGGVVNLTTGNFTSSNDDVVIRIGFQPRRVTVLNETDTIRWGKLVGMATANCTKETSSTLSVETGSQILFDQANVGDPVWTVTLAAALVGNSKAIVFVIEG